MSESAAVFSAGIPKPEFNPVGFVNELFYKLSDFLRDDVVPRDPAALARAKGVIQEPLNSLSRKEKLAVKNYLEGAKFSEGDIFGFIKETNDELLGLG